MPELPRGRTRPPADRAGAGARDRRRRRPRHLRVPPARARARSPPRWSATGSPRPTGAASSCGRRPTAGPDLGLHLGMAGRIVRRRAAGRSRWDRFVLEFADGGRMALRDKRRLGRAVIEPDFAHVGPDAAEVSRDAFRERVGRGTIALKARLLDQKSIAGVGNLLADETLWQARLSPAPPGGRADRRGARPPAPRAAQGHARRDPPRRRPHRRRSSRSASAAAPARAAARRSSAPRSAAGRPSGAPRSRPSRRRSTWSSSWKMGNCRDATAPDAA